ncbi:MULTISPECIES: trypsin-like peptidase domain-containing protein [unclassified Streptomyces]|uniref:trypsin-like serine peptidase n=1 Tax=unclassified Streptomyces TaxID=2593676 RepID=UPI001CD4F130|nr:trypsin-like peptidase domain-containing protein [Streptomyces sp. CoH27]
MKRTTRIWVHTRPALLGVVVMLALTSASVAVADEPSGPLGVTAEAQADRHTERVGALFGADRANDLKGGHYCTASVVHSPGRDLIVTAAHCVAGADDGGLLFVPGYRDGKAPYGVWKVGKRYLPDGWAKDQDEDSDVALAVVQDLKGRKLEDVVGGNRFTAGTETGATAVTVVGYPSSREVPIRCINKPTVHSRTQQRIDCPAFSTGTSGSPWINGDGQVVGVIGGHEEGGDTDDVSYSVVLGSGAAELYKDATSGR